MAIWAGWGEACKTFRIHKIITLKSTRENVLEKPLNDIQHYTWRISMMVEHISDRYNTNINCWFCFKRVFDDDKHTRLVILNNFSLICLRYSHNWDGYYDEIGGWSARPDPCNLLRSLSTPTTIQLNTRTSSFAINILQVWPNSYNIRCAKSI